MKDRSLVLVVMDGGQWSSCIPFARRRSEVDKEESFLVRVNLIVVNEISFLTPAGVYAYHLKEKKKD